MERRVLGGCHTQRHQLVALGSVECRVGERVGSKELRFLGRHDEQSSGPSPLTPGLVCSKSTTVGCRFVGNSAVAFCGTWSGAEW